ncbi:hypothetical protein [Stieleria varia]|uniref:Uncharacterized protein n=1 Tax=Stieleria varia TaxID=2528005 RepID=A0A5C6A3K4_9BACT|nr:hypothetical protein [Stieleria varia]TWT93955.1 hypothetical protein Pla52n_57830 [Stieleria varia]
MTLNPYQAPAELESDAVKVETGQEAEGSMSDRDRQAILSGINLVRTGHSVVVVMLFLTPIIATLSDLNPLDPNGGLFSGIPLGVGFGLMVSILGVAHWCTITQPQRRSAWLALVLQTFSMVAVYGYLMAVFNAGFANGFVRLFGASAFAGLLISQAVIALIMRSFALKCGDDGAKASCELSVVGYAIAASVASLIALGMPTPAGTKLVAYFLSGLFVLVGVSTKVRAAHSLLGKFRRESSPAI